MTIQFRNLRIRAYLKTGVISDQYLPLDGLLFFHLVRREKGCLTFTKSREYSINDIEHLSLPIKKTEQNGVWFYACSFAQFPENTAECSSFKVKSGDFLKHDTYFAGKKKIDIARGKFKNAHIKLYYRHALYIDWYCVGYPHQLAELLQFCTHIGKNSGDGWGEVLKWDICEWPEDWSTTGHDGKLMRNLPMEPNQGGLLYGIRPSYWVPHNITPCKMP